MCSSDLFNGVDDTSTILVTCNNPYELTQDCSNIFGAEKKIVIKDLKLGIFGNQEGNVVGVMTRSVWVTGFKKVYSIGLFTDDNMLHEALGEVEKVLKQNSIHITNKVLMKSFGPTDGFFLELDGDGYSILTQYEVNNVKSHLNQE